MTSSEPARCAGSWSGARGCRALPARRRASAPCCTTWLATSSMPESPTSPTSSSRVDAYWQEIDWEAPWFAGRERAAAQAALEALLRWHRDSPYEVVGAEVDFDLEVPLAAGVARVRGQIDRLERDGDGRGHVVDYKTGRSAPGVKDAQESPQLGLYQLAVLSGAVNAPDGSEGFSGTARCDAAAAAQRTATRSASSGGGLGRPQLGARAARGSGGSDRRGGLSRPAQCWMRPLPGTPVLPGAAGGGAGRVSAGRIRCLDPRRHDGVAR